MTVEAICTPAPVAHTLVASYEPFRPEADALADDLLVPVNTDVALAAATARGAVPGILVHRDAIASLLGPNVRYVDDLDRLAQGVDHVNNVYILATSNASHSGELAEGIALRDRLGPDVRSLVNRGVLPVEMLNAFSSRIGFRDVGVDLGVLATGLLTHWDAIHSRTPIERAEVDRATLLAAILKQAAVERDEPVATVAVAARDRQRALSLLLHYYDEIRRALTFVRWHEGDVNVIAPTLYVRAAPVRRKSEPVVAPATATPASTDATATATPAATMLALSTEDASAPAVPQLKPFAKG